MRHSFRKFSNNMRKKYILRTITAITGQHVFFVTKAMLIRCATILPKHVKSLRHCGFKACICIHVWVSSCIWLLSHVQHHHHHTTTTTTTTTITATTSATTTTATTILLPPPPRRRLLLLLLYTATATATAAATTAAATTTTTSSSTSSTSTTTPRLLRPLLPVL